MEVSLFNAENSFVNAAVELTDEGRSHDVIALCEKNLPERPEAIGHLAYALALLRAGRLVEGWSHLEFRWLVEPGRSLRAHFMRPAWAGQDLRGKTILLRAEQGFGDAIQFMRYVPHVKALGANVLLHVFPGIEQLAAAAPGVDRVLKDGDAVPEFDYHIHLMGLPRIFGTDVDSIPNTVPYLNVEPARVAQWSSRLGAKRCPRVGIVWAGSPAQRRNRYRSMALRALAPLGDVEGVHFISLQKGAAASEAAGNPPLLPLLDLGSELEDFSDTAAVVSQLDLVISVCTSVAHLAGALGKPVWVMLAEPADWRWLIDRDDSPWYPTARLFRQQRRGNWDDVVARVRVALQEWLRSEKTAHLPSAAQLAPALQVPMRPLVNMGMPSQVRQGFCAVAETRVGILEYRPDLEPVGKSIGWYGEYLQDELDLLAGLIAPGATVLEVGAGIGAHAIFLARIVGDAGHLFLYEPRPLQQRILGTNLVANGVSNVTVAETLDQFQPERLNLLKVNEEASGLDVLAKAADTLWRLRPNLFLAAADENALRDLSNCSKGFSYRCWRVQSALFNPRNFNRRNDDIFSGLSALALLAIPEEVAIDTPLAGCIEL